MVVPSGVIIRVWGPKIWETVYISEVNGTRKVKSDAHVAINKKLDPVQKLFPYEDGWGGQCFQIKFLQTSGIVRNELG